ncbi:hypothetical protein N7468_008649 [Penicillium chermesinum]|uniref:Uncharacterized protein n=1 Tax=Penicillium chermesinum TaxID=63820 RepID=A0A9W9NQ61_9EURO|nr:uncharacterized protein N7468_008649 [Penicillium chermesinum]KAJ5224107.1 hypothetical protein N7468_008649 [Penicillium chermesinum]KAJ6155078.1 hypothetical protein N7470_005644 [Penicillium chermesinum]
MDRWEEMIQKGIREYRYEVLDAFKSLGVPLSPGELEFLDEMEQLENDAYINEFNELGTPSAEIHGSRVRKEESERKQKPTEKKPAQWPMMRELADIQLGRWSGKPHWAVEN